jgi:radical SAM superfamily enzyme YgiQ (UPF0313 family)
MHFLGMHRRKKKRIIVRQSKMKILLVEPAYKNKYPPLGLMKISAFHKRRGDGVSFVKGLDKNVRGQLWDRIYVTTMFSFHWSEAIKTIEYYEFSVKDPQDLFIGGPMATLMAEEIQKETGFTPVLKGGVKVRQVAEENCDT